MRAAELRYYRNRSTCPRAVHYDNAPIAEAIIDFRVAWPDAAPDDVFQRLADRYAASFPVKKRLHAVEMSARVSDDDDAQFTQSDLIIGIRLDSAADAPSKRVVQFQKGGFTYSHLPPYTNWEAFSDEAVPLWDAYRTEAGVATVIRTAVRFINRFQFPVPLEQASNYVKVTPALPPSLPGVTKQYGMQFVRKLLIAPDSTAVIRCAAGEIEKGVTEFLLDFDVSINAQVAAESYTPWEWLGLLRDVKNKLFEEVITEPTRALIV